MNAFDTDCLIYAAVPGHPLGERITRLLEDAEPSIASVLLLPELLIKPVRNNAADEEARIQELLAHLELIEVDSTIGDAAVALGAKYGLRAVDSVHLATAVIARADRFVTNNRRDFTTSIRKSRSCTRPTSNEC